MELEDLNFRLVRIDNEIEWLKNDHDLMVSAGCSHLSTSLVRWRLESLSHQRELYSKNITKTLSDLRTNTTDLDYELLLQIEHQVDTLIKSDSVRMSLPKCRYIYKDIYDVLCGKGAPSNTPIGELTIMFYTGMNCAFMSQFVAINQQIKQKLDSIFSGYYVLEQEGDMYE